MDHGKSAQGWRLGVGVGVGAENGIDKGYTTLCFISLKK